MYDYLSGGEWLMGHVYVSALFVGNEGVHGEQSRLVDSGGAYTFLPLSVIEKTGAVRTC